MPLKYPKSLAVNIFLVIMLLSALSLAFHSAPAEDRYADGRRDHQALLRIESQSLGLPPVPFPADNRPTAVKIRLGRKLFFDRRLSKNGTLSCAMCHIPEQGYTVNEIATSVGNEGKTLRRNALTLLNVAFMGPLFHDGRETSLETQVISPLLDLDEMANPSIGYLIDRIGRMEDYDGLFEAAFGRRATIEAVGQAIATYERTLISANSPFDRWYFGKEKDVLTAKEQEGFRLFAGKANCVKCHRITGEHALFSDNSFHDTGLGWHKNARDPSMEETIQVQLAPGVFASVDRETVETVGLPEKKDLGRYEVTQDPSDMFRYKTPSLRNIALTAPYMHDGSLPTLREVVAFYNQGGHPHGNIDPLIKPLGLTLEEMDSLVAFLNSLTGDNIDELVKDARSEPVGNPGKTSSGSNPRSR
jgi:cytochrome c peroxidase